MKTEDLSGMLGPGVYVLYSRGRGVYVGWAKSVLYRVAMHQGAKRLPGWFPIPYVRFDRVDWEACREIDAERRVRELKAELVANESATAA